MSYMDYFSVAHSLSQQNHHFHYYNPNDFRNSNTASNNTNGDSNPTSINTNSNSNPTSNNINRNSNTSTNNTNSNSNPMFNHTARPPTILTSTQTVSISLDSSTQTSPRTLNNLYTKTHANNSRLIILKMLQKVAAILRSVLLSPKQLKSFILFHV